MDDKKIAKMRKPELIKLIGEMDKSINRQMALLREEKGRADNNVKANESHLHQMKEMEKEHKRFNMYLTLIELGLHHLDEGIMTQREFILLCQCVHEGRNQQFHREEFDHSDEA